MILRDVFTPAQPVVERSRFAGRREVLQRLIEIVEEQRSHVVVYGERGIGKTSLMHILADLARESQYLVIYESCGSNSGFDEVFRSALRQIPVLYLASAHPAGADVEAGRTIEQDVGDEAFNARRVGDLCAEITGTRVLIILDEYDRAQNEAFRQSIAELMKCLSDRAARVQILLAGVANDLQELTGYIPSIRRNVIGLPMPRMEETEIRGLLAIGEQAAGIRFDDAVTGAIVLLANGSPYLVRLLAHHASMRALDGGRLLVQLGDIRDALDRVIEEAHGRPSQQTLRQLDKAPPADAQLLAAVARAANTPDGWFTAREIVEQLGGRTEALAQILTSSAPLSRERVWRDAFLEVRKVEGGEAQYRFRDEALPTYLWMRLARERLAVNEGRDGEAGG